MMVVELYESELLDELYGKQKLNKIFVDDSMSIAWTALYLEDGPT
jgi:hypothetical protein